MVIDWRKVVESRNGNDLDRLTISVDGQRIGSHRFLVWLSDHVMSTEIGRLDPFQNPYGNPRIGGYRM